MKGLGVAGTGTSDRALPLGDDECLVYGRASPEAADAVGSPLRSLPHCEEVTVEEADGEV